MILFLFFTIPEGKEGRIVLQNILISGLSSQILTSYPTYLVLWQLHIHNSWTCLISNAFPCTDLCFCALKVEILTWLWISALIWPTVQVFFLISTATDLYLVFFSDMAIELFIRNIQTERLYINAYISEAQIRDV